MKKLKYFNQYLYESIAPAPSIAPGTAPEPDTNTPTITPEPSELEKLPMPDRNKDRKPAVEPDIKNAKTGDVIKMSNDEDVKFLLVNRVEGDTIYCDDIKTNMEHLGLASHSDEPFKLSINDQMDMGYSFELI
jgi:hypothetical protein